MDTMSSRRSSAAPGSALAVIACLMAFAIASQAQAATTQYPAGGSTFSGGSQGWTSTENECSLLSGVSVACSTTNAYDGTVGNPAGSITTRVEVTLNVLGLFQGAGTWQSPAFTVPAGDPVTAATFRYDRRVDSEGVLDLQPSSEVVVSLFDEAAGTSTTVSTETVTTDLDTFTARSVAVPAGAVQPGRSYRLRIRTSTGSSVAGVLGQADTRFENASLSVTTGKSTGGPNISDGVSVVRRSVSNTEISNLIRRIGIESEVGNGPGGSRVPLASCTIVGTPGNDRIVGTRANEVICGLGGKDVIQGGGGRDVIDGGNGADRLGGGSGGDLLLGLRGNDRSRGGAGKDGIGGGRGRDTATVDGARSSKRAARRADRVRRVERIR
jgi:Ca2+-binding RTX toxin-like protein